MTIKDLNFTKLQLMKPINNKFWFRNVWSLYGTIFAKYEKRIIRLNTMNDWIQLNSPAVPN